MEAFNNILKPKTFNVLIIDFSKNHGVSAFVVRKKKVLEISSELKFDNIEAFCNSTKNGYPILLHCKGKGVISRETEIHTNLRDNLTVNGDKIDFYFNELHEERAFVSMARKDMIDPIIEVLKSYHWIVYNLTIGPFILKTICETGLIENDYHIQINGWLIQAFSKSVEDPREFNYNNESLSAEKQYALATVLVLKDESSWIFPIDQKNILVNRKESAEKRKFILFGTSILSFFLILLVSNYFFQGYLSQTNADLEGEISVYGGNLSQIDQLNSEISRKKELVSSSAVSSSNYLTFYIDQIVCSVPNGIKLNEMDIYPMKEKLKQKRRVSLEETIRVEGEVNNSRVMDNWVLDLEKLSWTDKIQIINFSRIKSSKATFEIKIFIEK